MRPTDALQARGLKLVHLHLLALLAETGQLGLAASLMGVAQPAASRLLAEAERIVGQPLRARAGRGLVLTPVGAALAARAARVQVELRDAARDLADIGAGARGHVRVGSVTGPALDRVLPALATLRAAFAQVTAEVIVGTSDTLGPQVASGRIDFAVARLPEGAAGGLRMQPLAAEQVALVVRRGHPLAQGAGPVTGADLMRHDWVMPGAETLLTRTVLARLRALRLGPPPMPLSTASFLLTLALVRQSDAIAPLARAVADSFAGAGADYTTLPVDLGIVVEPFGLVTLAGRQLPGAALRLAQIILGAESTGSGAPAVVTLAGPTAPDPLR